MAAKTVEIHLRTRDMAYLLREQATSFLAGREALRIRYRYVRRSRKLVHTG